MFKNPSEVNFVSQQKEKKTNFVQKKLQTPVNKMQSGKPLTNSSITNTTVGRNAVATKVKSDLTSKVAQKKMPPLPQRKILSRYQRTETPSLFSRVRSFFKNFFSMKPETKQTGVALSPVTIHTSVKVSQLRIFDCTQCGKIIMVPEMEKTTTFLCKRCNSKYNYGKIIENGYVEAFNPDYKKERMKWANYVVYAIIFLLSVPMAGIMLETKQWLWGTVSIVGISLFFRWVILKVFDRYAVWMKLWGYFFTILGFTLAIYIWIGALLRNLSPLSVSDFFIFPIILTILGFSMLVVDKIDSRKLKMF